MTKQEQAVPSLKYRLTRSLGLGMVCVWVAAGLGSALVSLHEINDAEDDKMQYLAQTLLRLADRLPEQPDLIKNDDDDNGFAIWKDGQIVLADETGRQIPFQAASGFQNSAAIWDWDSQRYAYEHDSQSGLTVAVAQEFHERWAALYNALWVHLIVLLLALPVLVWLLRRNVNQSLQPLNHLAAQVQQRSGSDLQALNENVPKEAKPLVQSFNRLLERVSHTLQRERRFSADAAHELRSPLAALKIQTEVLAMSQNDDERQHHIQQLLASIDRASHLTDQLLVLSRLEPMQTLPETENLDWLDLSRQTLSAVNFQAREKQIRLKLQDHFSGSPNTQLPLVGSSTLVQLMLRNLLENAIRYSPENSTVTLYLSAHDIRICDEGQGIALKHLSRVRDRFYRPAGQTQTGSGLGLSIVETIAALHGLQLNLTNQPQGGLCASLTASK